MSGTKKTALLIGASFESVFSIKTAQSCGFFVIALDGNPNAQGLKYADEFFVVDIADYKRICSLLFENKIEPSVVLPAPVGKILDVTAKICDHFQLMGPSYSCVHKCTDKYLFHNELNNAGLRDAVCLLLAKNTQFDRNKLFFPSVLKPRFGSGSRDVRVIQSQTDLEKYIFNKLPFDEDMILESFVKGSEFAYDALIVGNTVHSVSLKRKINTPLPYRQCTSYSICNDSAVISLVEEFFFKVCKLLGIKNSIIQSDLVVNDDGIFLIEMSPRPTGHYIYNVFNPKILNINVIELFLKLSDQSQSQFSANQKVHASINFFDLKAGTISLIPDFEKLKKEKIISDYLCNLKVGDKIEYAVDGKTLIPRGYFIIEEKKDKERELALSILNMFDIKQ